MDHKQQYKMMLARSWVRSSVGPLPPPCLWTHVPHLLAKDNDLFYLGKIHRQGICAELRHKDVRLSNPTDSKAQGFAYSVALSVRHCASATHTPGFT